MILLIHLQNPDFAHQITVAASAGGCRRVTCLNSFVHIASRGGSLVAERSPRDIGRLIAQLILLPIHNIPHVNREFCSVVGNLQFPVQADLLNRFNIEPVCIVFHFFQNKGIRDIMHSAEISVFNGKLIGIHEIRVVSFNVVDPDVPLRDIVAVPGSFSPLPDHFVLQSGGARNRDTDRRDLRPD